MFQHLQLPDPQIQDAIDQCEWRHALQLIEKKERRLKKGETIEWLTACKASVQLMLPDAAKQRQGRALLESLYSRKPPVVDIRAVMTIEAFAKERNDIDDRIDVLWSHATNARPNDDDLHRHWFKMRFWAKDWQGARKAAMAYTKHSPNKREPFFWAIFANFMASKSAKISDQEKTLCGTMAYRMCAKAAEDVNPEEGKEPKSGRVLRSPGDLAFLLDVYESQGKSHEALAVLHDPRTGIWSYVGKRSWNLVLRMIRLLEQTNQWRRLLIFCFNLLEDARPKNLPFRGYEFRERGNDWSVWVAMLRALANLREVKEDTDNCFPAHVKRTGRIERLKLSQIMATICVQGAEHTEGRNGMCARMLLDVGGFCSLDDDGRSGINLVESCCAYFKAYGKQPFCFSDLKTFLQALDSNAIQSLMQEVRFHVEKEHADLYGEEEREQMGGLNDLEPKAKVDVEYFTLNVNMLKIEYYLIHSRWENSENLEDSVAIERFVVECIKLYDLALSSHPRVGEQRLPGDDAGHLAAMALLRLHSFGNRPKALLQAVTTLEHLVDKSPFNYEAIVTLTALYTRLGIGGLAAAHYSRLLVKNIQYTSMSWLLATRVSSVYPHAPRIDHKDLVDKHNADPVTHLAFALEYHLQLRESDEQEIIHFLETGQYANLIQGMGHSVYNQLGYTKYMLLVELARIERLSGVHEKLEYWKLADYMPPLPLDNRDRSPIPHWEALDVTSFAELITPGRWPSHKWLSQQALVALSFDHATKQNKLFPRDDVMESVVASNDFKASSTPVEDAQTNLARDLHWISMIYEHKLDERGRKQENAETVADKFTKLRTWQQEVNNAMTAMIEKDGCHLRKIAQGTNVPDWEFFHEVYTGLDNLRLVEKTTDVVLAENPRFELVDQKVAKQQTATIRGLCDDYRNIVHKAALHLKNSLSDKKHRRSMVYSVVSRQDDTDHKDPIGYWLRHAFGNEQYAQKTLARLNASWKDALVNISDLTRPRPGTRLPLR